MRVRIARSARRHRIGNAHILAALRDAGKPTVVNVELGPQLHYRGRDDRGIELHLIAVPDDKHPGGITIIHAMPTSFTDPWRML